MKYVEMCKRGAWHLRVWKKKKPTEILRVQFRCHSWRCEGDCCRWKAAQDFVRVKEAIEGRDHWNFLTLTFANQKEKRVIDLFKGGVTMWAKLRKRMVRYFEDIKYIQTWEIHNSGYPHVHVAISNRMLFDCCTSGRSQNFERFLLTMATECGFGKRGTIERLHGKAAMAGYLTKLARELTGGAVKSQIPVNAPRHFRRLRASVGLLPPVARNEDYTGILCKFRDHPDHVETLDVDPEQSGNREGGHGCPPVSLYP